MTYSPPAPDAQSDARHLVRAPQQGESYASVAQAEVHQAQDYYRNNPQGYNDYIVGLKHSLGSAVDPQILGDVQFYDSQALATTLAPHPGDAGYTEQSGLSQLGYNGDDAAQRFKSDHGFDFGSNGTSGTSVEQTGPQDAISRFADGSSRGVHTDESGNVIAINETNANGESRKLVLQPDGKWAVGDTASSGEAAEQGTQEIQYKLDPNTANFNGTAPDIPATSRQ